MARDFQIVIWGATGFTGQLVTEYLQRHYGESIRWAIAGRNELKLKALKDRLQLNDSVDCLLGDSLDEESLRTIAAKTDVIISTVGPYALYGKSLVAACVHTKTDYCDLTGEVTFVKDIIDCFDQAARDKKVKIVHSCGFDSIPSDIGCLLLQKQFQATYSYSVSEVTATFTSIQGALSGGTIASMINLLKQMKNDKHRQVQLNPYVLCNNSTCDFLPPHKDHGLRYDRRILQWTIPFVMGKFNSSIVLRTNDLKDFPYGPNFNYEERLAVGSGFKGILRGYMQICGLFLFKTLMSFSITRFLLLKTILPKPGQGPTRTQRDSGYFTMELSGQDAQTDKAVVLSISDSLDPGYGSTSKMLVETALCLALNKDHLPQIYGVVTPAVAMGEIIAKRLQQAGLQFIVLQ